MKTSFCPNKLVLNETKLIQKLWPIEPTKPETLRRFLIQVLTTNFTQLFRLRAKWWKGSGNRLRVEFLFGYSASKPNLLGVIFWIFWRGILCSLWYTYCKTKKRVSCMSPFYFLKLLSLFFLSNSHTTRAYNVISWKLIDCDELYGVRNSFDYMQDDERGQVTGWKWSRS